MQQSSLAFLAILDFLLQAATSVSLRVEYLVGICKEFNLIGWFGFDCLVPVPVSVTSSASVSSVIAGGMDIERAKIQQIA